MLKQITEKATESTAPVVFFCKPADALNISEKRTVTRNIINITKENHILIITESRISREKPNKKGIR
jgi:hypothetical protein